jgi:hypothetical protein
MNTDAYLEQLETDGILILDGLIPEKQLKDMQRTFNQKLQNLSFNSTSGFQRYEMYRDYVEDLLMVDRSFVKFAVNPEITKIIKGYISEKAVLKECRGWRTRIVKKHFHSWHKDGWYDKKIHHEPPRQLKAVVYLTDVDSGSFAYIKGSHVNVKRDPHILHEHYTDEFLKKYEDDKVFATGKAGTVVIFDTAGIHCQSSPNLLPRNAVFYTYHSPEVHIDPSELEYGRYGPLLISNYVIDDTFTVEDLRVLGFFQKEYGSRGTQELTRYPILSSIVRAQLETTIYLHEYVFSNAQRVFNKLFV